MCDLEIFSEIINNEIRHKPSLKGISAFLVSSGLIETIIDLSKIKNVMTIEKMKVSLLHLVFFNPISRTSEKPIKLTDK